MSARHGPTIQPTVRETSPQACTLEIAVTYGQQPAFTIQIIGVASGTMAALVLDAACGQIATSWYWYGQSAFGPKKALKHVHDILAMKFREEVVHTWQIKLKND